MTATQINLNKQERKSAKKGQTFRNTNIGTPLAPVRPRPQKKQEHEVLSDWSHAS